MTDQLAVTQRKIAVARQVASEARIMFLLNITFIKPQSKPYLSWFLSPGFDESGDQGGDEAAAHEAPVVAGVDGDCGPGGQS